MSNNSFLPPYGCMKEIQRLTGYDRKTITTALRHNARGVKAERVREIFRAKYMNKTEIKE